MSAHPPYVTVTKGLRGWFAVMLSWNPEHGGFYEPWQTGDSSYETEEQARQDAKSWAEAEEVGYR